MVDGTFGITPWRGAIAAIALMTGATSTAWALPSPLNHTHTADTVHWAEVGAPAFPWNNVTANTWDHNHLTADDISNSPKWVINKAWDNRTLHSSFTGSTDWAHGMILSGNAVRYGWDGTDTPPDDAKDVVEDAFDDWIAKATTQFNAKKDPWDRFAMDFDRVNSGAKEINVKWVDAYGVFSSTTQTIQFWDDPDIDIWVEQAGWQVRVAGGGAFTDSLTQNVGWSYDGNPDSVTTLDLEYSNDGGTTVWDGTEGGFGALGLNIQTSSFNEFAAGDDLEFFEMDFMTIALHEVGHAIALGHTGEGSAPIMRDDIAINAAFDNTMGIDNDSALAVAINYTYAVPAPAALPAMLLMTALGAARRRRR